MASEKLVQLMENLLEATSEGRIHWNEATEDDAFRVDLDTVKIIVAREDEDVDDHFQYSVELRSLAGKLLELEIFFRSHDNAQYEIAAKLFEKARQSALKIDQIIDSVIDSLKKK